jgi:hypothetical protein
VIERGRVERKGTDRGVKGVGERAHKSWKVFLRFFEIL